MATDLIQIDRASGKRKQPGPKPPWLKIRLQLGEDFHRVNRMISGLKLHTVCQEARCPNIYECWTNGTATFMILGDTCTRHCGYCAVHKARKGVELDPDEPRHVAEAVRQLNLQHAVVTSVDRDDLPDGGAAHFAETIHWIRKLNPSCAVEVLIPDFNGDERALSVVLDARPDVLNHNTETVPRLYRRVRPVARYDQSLELLRRSAERKSSQRMITKSGLMLGLGETEEEVIQTMRDLRTVDCDVLTLGQYLAPTVKHLPVEKYYHPDEFAYLKQVGLDLGFKYVESGPLVRSSYHAHEHKPVT